MEEVEEKFNFTCSKDIAINLLENLKRNYYIANYEEEFARKFIIIHLEGFLNDGKD